MPKLGYSNVKLRKEGVKHTQPQRGKKKPHQADFSYCNTCGRQTKLRLLTKGRCPSCKH